MGFRDEHGYSLINNEQKVRIALGERATLVMSEDMAVFSESKESAFINTVFENYREEAKSSVYCYLEQREQELKKLLPTDKLRKYKQAAIEKMLEYEEKEIRDKVRKYKEVKAYSSKIYHINKDNVKYLEDECDENQYYNEAIYAGEKPYYSHPAKYIRSVIEEYCSLPFIKRERIYRKEVYEKIQNACEKNLILSVVANYHGKKQEFYVYPYKIVPDSFHTQSYLVCYSRMKEEDEQKKRIASFSMARIELHKEYRKKFDLSKQEIKNLESSIAKNSVAYLVGETEEIKVQLTKKGESSYRSRLYSRPEKIKKEKNSKGAIYTFNCTQQQIYNYFFSFGADAEIISPENLRDRFKRTYEKAGERYHSDTTES